MMVNILICLSFPFFVPGFATDQADFLVDTRLMAAVGKGDLLRVKKPLEDGGDLNKPLQWDSQPGRTSARSGFAPRDRKCSTRVCNPRRPTPGRSTPGRSTACWFKAECLTFCNLLILYRNVWDETIFKVGVQIGQCRWGVEGWGVEDCKSPTSRVYPLRADFNAL